MAARIKLASRVGLGHKFALRPIAKARRSTSTARSSASPTRTSPPAMHVHVHNVSADSFERDYAFCRECPPPLPASGAALLPGLRPRRWPLRHAQLHRHHQHRQLLRQHEQVHLRKIPQQRPVETISQRRWRGGHHPQGRLRHAVRRFRPQPTRPHARRFRPACQRRRLYPHRSRLRDRPGNPPHREAKTDPVERLGEKKPLVISMQECGGIGKTVEAGVKAMAEMLPHVNEVSGRGCRRIN